MVYGEDGFDIEKWYAFNRLVTAKNKDEFPNKLTFLIKNFAGDVKKYSNESIETVSEMALKEAYRFIENNLAYIEQAEHPKSERSHMLASHFREYRLSLLERS